MKRFIQVGEIVLSTPRTRNGFSRLASDFCAIQFRLYPTPLLKFVEVALPLPVDRQYTYGVPDTFSDPIETGFGVVVPFGKRTMTGIVTHVTNEAPDFSAKDIIDLVDEEALLTDEQLNLTKWISDYYLCTWGEAARASLPPGVDTVSELRVRRNPDGITSGLQDQEIRLLSQIPVGDSASIAAIRRQFHDVSLAKLRSLEKRGVLVIEQNLRGPRTRVRYDHFVRLENRELEIPVRGTRQQAVLNALDGTEGMLQSHLLKQTGATSATLRRLKELGLLDIQRIEIDRSSMNGHSDNDTPRHSLNEYQQRAVDILNSASEKGVFQTFLLHGITGSGKTEVYLEVLESVRMVGKSAIILVPEISLTPQTVRRFRARFGDDISVLHSRMSQGERFDAWRGIRAGQYPIVVGPRSAILAPVSNLGLVVVDEEHESSYKQFDPAPRYHARDVAVIRAQLNRAICVLGSATPSLESLSNARSGKYQLLSLPERVETDVRKAILPKIRIVDMRSEPRRDSGQHTLSATLRDAINERLQKNQQVILLQNRRGYAPVIRCDACSWDPECPDCSVSMTYHKARRHLRCHYCGRTARLPHSCPKCGHPITQLGVGTQRVEEELKDVFPDARIARMDLDTTAGKNSHDKILHLFGSGKKDILLGTQMVAKGLDFERVTLVGVIDADAGMSLPDIRAEERAFHLLTQVAGRAGRADYPGEVVFQTRNPGHRVIQFALRHDYDGFTKEILDERRVLGYPPAGRLIGILFSGPQEGQLMRLATQWCKAALSQTPDIALLGPSASFIGKVRNRYRVQVMIKTGPGEAHKRARRVVRDTNKHIGALPKGYRLAVDVDPAGLM